jgi:drug/metabolite transporter (DMT)-like permease
MFGIGEVAALTAALMWSVSSLLWRDIKLSAGAMNLSKNVIGLALMLLHLGVLTVVTHAAAFTASASSIGLLIASGLVGVAIGDTLFLRSLQILGPRIALMMATTSPIFSVVLGLVFLREQLLIIVVAGILLTVAGLIIVLTDRAAAKEAPNMFPGKVAAGVWCGTAAAFCQSVGGVLSRAGSQDCSGLEAAIYRIAVGMVVLIIFYRWQRKLKDIARTVFQWKMIKLLLPATVLGTWMGVWLCQVAYKNSDVAIAQTLLSTCPLFAVPVIWFWDGQRISARGFVGTLIAVAGVALVVRFSA